MSDADWPLDPYEISVGLLMALQPQIKFFENARPTLDFDIPEKWPSTILPAFLWGMAMELLPNEAIFAEDTHKQIQMVLKEFFIRHWKFEPAQADEVAELMRQRFVNEDPVFEEILIRGVMMFREKSDGWLLDAIRIIYGPQ
jgi:hypothetical protein